MMKVWNFVYVTAVVLALMAVADWRGGETDDSSWTRETKNWHLGAEYNSIARAIYAGRGFSDPFKTESGPTAWMPPVLSYFLAGLYWVTDFNPQAVIELVVVFIPLIAIGSASRRPPGAQKQVSTMPPSHRIAAPVVAAACSLHRYVTSAATSLGSAKRWINEEGRASLTNSVLVASMF